MEQSHDNVLITGPRATRGRSRSFGRVSVVVIPARKIKIMIVQVLTQDQVLISE